MSLEGDLSDIKKSISLHSLGESRSYLFEYTLYLVLNLGLLVGLIAIGRSFVEEFEAGFILNYMWSYTPISLLSMIIAILPFLYIVTRRVNSAEKSNLQLKNLGWRKVFLGVFLLITSLWAIIEASKFISGIVNYLSVDMPSGGDYAWKQGLYLAIATAILVKAVLFGLRDYRYKVGQKEDKLLSLYRYGMVATGLIVVLLFIVFPLDNVSGRKVDTKIVEDMNRIQLSVNSKYTQNMQLPVSLVEMGLSDDVVMRANNFDYTYEIKGADKYELCADFRQKSSSSTEIIPAFKTTSSAISPEYPNFFEHEKGHFCFAVDAFDYNSTPGFTAEDTTELVDPQDLVDVEETSSDL